MKKLEKTEFIESGEAAYWTTILFIVLAILFGGCNNVPPPYKRVQTFVYKNHNYIKFDLDTWSYGMHDPDCSNPIHKCN